MQHCALEILNLPLPPASLGLKQDRDIERQDIDVNDAGGVFFFVCGKSTYWPVSQILHCLLVPWAVQQSGHVVSKLLPSSQKVTHQEWD